jgi:hypothetical protein
MMAMVCSEKRKKSHERAAETRRRKKMIVIAGLVPATHEHSRRFVFMGGRDNGPAMTL